jgi:hypothetical protein
MCSNSIWPWTPWRPREAGEKLLGHADPKAESIVISPGKSLTKDFSRLFPLPWWEGVRGRGRVFRVTYHDRYYFYHPCPEGGKDWLFMQGDPGRYPGPDYSSNFEKSLAGGREKTAPERVSRVNQVFFAGIFPQSMQLREKRHSRPGCWKTSFMGSWAHP